MYTCNIPLINTHTHAAMVGFRGLAEDLPLDKWLNDVIWPAEAKEVNKSFVYEQSKKAIKEMKNNKIKAFADMYFFQEEVAKLAEQEKIHILIWESIIDFPTPSSPSPELTLEKVEKMILEYKNSEYVKVSVAAHSIYTVSKENLLKAKKLARKYDVIFQMHMAETKWEFDDSIRDHGVTPVQYADSLGLLDNKTILAHCVWLTDEDISILANRGVHVSHCPLSNMKLGSGIAPIQKMLDKWINISLWTDGSASSNRLDIWEAAKFTALVSKVHNLDPTCIPIRQLVKMMSINGMKALGLDSIDGQTIEDIEKTIEETDYSFLYHKNIDSL